MESVKGPSCSIPILLIESVGLILTSDTFHNFSHPALVCLETSFIGCITLLILYFNCCDFPWFCYSDLDGLKSGAYYSIKLVDVNQEALLLVKRRDVCGLSISFTKISPESSFVYISRYKG